jgi:hypothetical protein
MNLFDVMETLENNFSFWLNHQILLDFKLKILE